MGNDSINPENDNDEEDEALYRSRVRVEGAELVTPPVRVTTFSALKVRDYRWFWLSTLAGSASMQMQILGRLWLVYALTGSALALGIVAAARGGAILIFSLYGGAVADRVKKRNLLLVTQSANAVVALAIAILISTGAIIWQHLIIAAVLNGLVFSFNSPGRQSFIPELVGRGRCSQMALPSITQP